MPRTGPTNGLDSLVTVFTVQRNCGSANDHGAPGHGSIWYRHSRPVTDRQLPPPLSPSSSLTGEAVEPEPEPLGPSYLEVAMAGRPRPRDAQATSPPWWQSSGEPKTAAFRPLYEQLSLDRKIYGNNLAVVRTNVLRPVEIYGPFPGTALCSEALRRGRRSVVNHRPLITAIRTSKLTELNRQQHRPLFLILCSSLYLAASAAKAWLSSSHSTTDVVAPRQKTVQKYKEKTSSSFIVGPKL
ncbi:unnamed protein product [Soboliphyme baturini]|uniref:Uncharacterized protein n=1 Tax=Soboliphyme baturini TaxID=241478 RepID=A0A183IRF3_9BILA|nr:unnamed protein product [Soboliphyme baturini]